MTFRFRQTVRILPWLRVNIGKRGLSATVGGRGASLTHGTKGTQATVSAPGTGISYTHRIGKRGAKPPAAQPEQVPARQRKRSPRLAIACTSLALLWILGVGYYTFSRMPDRTQQRRLTPPSPPSSGTSP